MTLPPPISPVWLAPGEVAAWLKLPPASVPDDAVLAMACAAAEPQVQSARPDMWATVLTADELSRVYHPDAEVRLAAVMLAARVYRRRNSPGGMETSFDQIAYVSRYDPEIERALRQGRSRKPAVG